MKNPDTICEHCQKPLTWEEDFGHEELRADIDYEDGSTLAYTVTTQVNFITHDGREQMMSVCKDCLIAFIKGIATGRKSTGPKKACLRTLEDKQKTSEWLAKLKQTVLSSIVKDTCTKVSAMLWVVNKTNMPAWYCDEYYINKVLQELLKEKKIRFSYCLDENLKFTEKNYYLT